MIAPSTGEPKRHSCRVDAIEMGFLSERRSRRRSEASQA
jgi:hypothetical protein